MVTYHCESTQSYFKNTQKEIVSVIQYPWGCPKKSLWGAYKDIVKAHNIIVNIHTTLWWSERIGHLCRIVMKAHKLVWGYKKSLSRVHLILNTQHQYDVHTESSWGHTETFLGHTSHCEGHTDIVKVMNVIVNIKHSTLKFRKSHMGTQTHCEST